MTQTTPAWWYTPAAPPAPPRGFMLTDDCFNGIALQFQAYPKLFHRGQKLMNIMPPF